MNLFYGDCVDYMRALPDASVDMILCDLPYGTTRNKWDAVIPFDALWSQYRRVIKDNGVIVLFCDGMFTAKLIQSNEKMWRYNMVWDKQRGCDFLNANVKPLKCHEDIAVFYKKNQYDKETNVIAKGIASVKFMSAAIGNELYALAHDDRPETFMDLLLRIENETSLNSRQRDILIKIDYFSDYGNAKELLRMVEVFTFFKNGAMKKISKEKLSAQFEQIVRKYSTDVSKSGAPAKSYTILDMRGLLNEFECRIRELHIHDFDYKSKMQNQLENMGYIDLTTNKPEDRRKLMIMDIYPLISKEDNLPWAYGVRTRSIGSGKTARLTLSARVYDQQPVAKHDVILATDVSKNYKGYWYLNAFSYVV